MRTGLSATAEVALQGRKSSRLHHEAILNREQWEGVTWQAMGVAIYKTSAAICFGELTDPEGESR